MALPVPTIRRCPPRWGPPSSAAAGRRGAHVHPLTLRPVERQQLGGPVVGVARPVRGAGVELGDLAGGEDDVGVAEQQPQPARQHVDPLVPLVRALLTGLPTPVRRQGLLGGLPPPPPPASRSRPDST